MIEEVKGGSGEEAKEESKTVTDEQKQKAKEAENEAAQEIIAKFGVEYSQIKLDKVNLLVKQAKDLHLFNH